MSCLFVAHFQAVANYKGQNDFFSRLDPDGLCNKTLTEKTAKIQKLISRIYDRVKFERSFSEGWVTEFWYWIVKITSAIFRSEGSTTFSDVETDDVDDNLKIIDESYHGVSLVSLIPPAIDISSLKVRLMVSY